MLHVVDTCTRADKVVCSLGIRWEAGSAGWVPQHAVQAGLDKDGGLMFVGRAKHSSDLLPAKIVPNQRTAYVSFAGKEHAIANYEVKTAVLSIRKVAGSYLSQQTILIVLIL